MKKQKKPMKTKVASTAARTKIALPLQKKYNAIQPLLANAERNDARARYEVGVHVVEVMDDQKQYGEEAVKKLAKLLGRDEDSLYDYARVARTWSSVEFNKLMKRETPRKMPLSLSHLVVLADETVIKKRDRLLEEALSTGLSVRALAHRIGLEGPAPPAAGPVQDVKSSVAKVLPAIATVLERAKKEPASPKLLAELENALTQATSITQAVEALTANVRERIAQMKMALEKTSTREAAE